MVIGVPIALVAFANGPAAAVILLGIAGVGKSFFDVTARTLLQRSVDDDVLARVFGVQEGLAMAALAVGSVIAPILVNRLGVEPAFILAGLTLPLIALLVFQRIRAVDRDAALADPEAVALLRRTSIFGPLGPANLERVARNMVPLEVAAGVVVIKEGDAGDRFYVIEAGRVVVSKAGAALVTLGPGDFFGEIALLRDVPRTATVKAEETCSLQDTRPGALPCCRDRFAGRRGRACDRDGPPTLRARRLTHLAIWCFTPGDRRTGLVGPLRFPCAASTMRQT